MNEDGNNMNAIEYNWKEENVSLSVSGVLQSDSYMLIGHKQNKSILKLNSGQYICCFYFILHLIDNSNLFIGKENNGYLFKI